MALFAVSEKDWMDYNFGILGEKDFKSRIIKIIKVKRKISLFFYKSRCYILSMRGRLYNVIFSNNIYGKKEGKLNLKYHVNQILGSFNVRNKKGYIKKAD